METANFLPRGSIDTMEAASKTCEKQSGAELIDSDDDFKYEEVSLGDECSLTEGEEDLEATVKAIQDRAEADARHANATREHKPTNMVEFLRTFLCQRDMRETLDCFQTEWTEVTAKGLVEPDQVGAVPDIYVENLHLEIQLQNARREREEYRRAASAAAGTLERVRRARDSYRLQHQRVVQEKNRLIEEMRKLQLQCSDYEPAVKRMNEKYQAALRQVMQMAVERDKALGQKDSQSQGGGEAGDETEEPDRETAPSVTQPRPPAGPCRPARGRAVKTLTA